MKKIFITFILLFSIIYNVYAIENYGDVKGKYLYEQSSNFYRERLIPNNKVNVETENGTFSVLADNYFDNVDIVLIKSSNALLGLDNISDDAIVYYVDFYQNDVRFNPNGTIKISSNDKLHLSVVSFYSSNGIKEKEINVINDRFFLDITHRGYLIIEESVLNELSIDSDHGNVIIDGVSYKDKYYTKNTSLSLIIAPSANYITKKIIFNGVEKKLNGGFISLDLVKNNILKITYIKDEEESLKKFSITGKLVENNVPVVGAKVVLHSTEKVTYTSSDGLFRFDNVEYGFHTLSVYDDSLLLGYKEFNVATDKVINVVQTDGDIDQIVFAPNTTMLNMNVTINDNYEVTLSNLSNLRLGDVNLDNLVNINDLINMRKYLVNLVSFNETSLNLADVNLDNKVNINDVIKMRKYLAGLEEL